MDKLSKEYLESIISHKEYVKHTTPSGKLLRWCVLTLNNGFAVVGQPSSCVDPSLDNPKIGESVAYQNSFDKLWELEGYLLNLDKHKREQLTTTLIEQPCLWNYQADKFGNIEGLVICSKKDILDNVGKEVYYYGYTGKHSEFFGEIEESQFTLVSDDPLVVQKLLDKTGHNVMGAYPFSSDEGGD